MSIVAAALILLASTAEPPAPAPSPAAPAKAENQTSAEQADFDPMVCVIHQELGSRVKRRKVCLHKSEWDRQNQEEKQMINRTQVLRGLDKAG